MADGTCSIDGCDEPIRELTWCAAHYKRWLKGDAPEERAACSVNDCDRPVRARGWCYLHWARWKRLGDVQADKPIRARQPDQAAGTTCSVPGCEEPHFARTWCSKHYSRWQRTGDVQSEKPIMPVLVINAGACSVEDCEKDAFHRGLCAMHYSRQKRHGNLEHPVTEEVRAARRERRRAYGRAWKAAERARDAGAVNARHQAWVAANPERVRLHDARKRHLRAAAPRVLFSVDELDSKLRYWGYKCWLCEKPYEAIDHVKPLAAGGWHVLANLRPICAKCNGTKNARWPFTVPPGGWRRAA